MPDGQRRRPFVPPGLTWSRDYPMAPAPSPPPEDDSVATLLMQQPGLMDKLAATGMRLQSLFGSSPPPSRERPGDIELPSPKNSMAALRRKTR